jgi:hypothetical protein
MNVALTWLVVVAGGLWFTLILWSFAGFFGHRWVL